MLLIADLPPEILHEILVVFCVGYMGVDHENCRWAVQRALRLKLVCRESHFRERHVHYLRVSSKYVPMHLSGIDMT